MGSHCGLLVLLLGIPTAANRRFAKIFYGAVVSPSGHLGLRGLLLGLDLLGEIPGQERCPLPTIVYGAGEYRVRVASFQRIKIFDGAGPSRLVPCGLLALGLESPVEFLGWGDPALVNSTKTARDLSLQGSKG